MSYGRYEMDLVKVAVTPTVHLPLYSIFHPIKTKLHCQYMQSSFQSTDQNKYSVVLETQTRLQNDTRYIWRP